MGRAPVAGRISRDLVNKGNLVGSTEATLLTVIVVDDPMFAYFNVDERSLVEILRQYPDREKAQATIPARLILADGGEHPHLGVVDFGENRVDPQTGTLQVRATIPNPDGGLFPGLFVRVRIPDQTGEFLIVPELALQRDLAGAFLLVVDDQNVVQRRDVVRGRLLEQGAERIIVSGLDGSERVIVNGLQRSRPGITVDPEEAAPASAGG